MGRAFNHSFADIRVHDGDEGDRVARAHDALALTVGEQLFFRDGAFEPDVPFGARVLAHELAHVVQQHRPGARDEASSTAGAESSPEATADGGDRGGEEMEADAAADAVMRGNAVDVVAGSVTAGTPQRWPWDDDGAKGGTDGGLLGSLGSLASGAWDATKGAAGAVYDNYQKSTDFKPVAAGEGSKIDWSGSKPISLPAALGAGIDWYEKSTAENNKKAEESVKGIPVLEQLAQASSFISNTTTGITGGIARGVGDIGFGVANAFFHPIDAAMGLEGILEHNSTVPFLGSTLKAVHGAYDIATGNEKGEYGKTWGELANHVFNPLQQQKDDANYNSNLLRGIVAPGTKDWDEAWGKVKENPADMLSRAATNVVPIALGVGELAAGEGTAGAASAAPKGPVIPEPPPPTLRTPYLPKGVPAPKPFNPDIPTVTPPEVIPPPDTIPGGPQFPKLPGEPIPPEPIPRLPGGPKKGPPIPREDPFSRPVDTPRQPMDIPGIPAEEPLPSTQPRPSTVPEGPVTQDAPRSSQGSAVPTERGLQGLPAIPRGMDPGIFIDLIMDTPGGKSVVQLMQELGFPVERR